jgi:anti-anti-sigma factor
MVHHQWIDVERRGEVCCVRLRRAKLEEHELAALSEELLGLVENEGHRKVALALGPEAPEFLYSVFLAKLVQLRRLLADRAGELLLSYAGPEVRNIFTACALDKIFQFVPDFDAALAHWGELPQAPAAAGPTS